MTYLLDTQAAIWFIESSSALSSTAKRCIQDNDNTIVLSRISLFEIAIKIKIGKLKIRRGIKGFIDDLNSERIHIYPVTDTHILSYQLIPLFEQHRDPFDRLILATALAENWPVISADEKFRLYDGVVQLIW